MNNPYILPTKNEGLRCQIYFGTKRSVGSEPYGLQVFNKDLDIYCSAEVVGVLHTYLSAMNEIQSGRKILMWDAFTKLAATQAVPSML